MSVASVGSLLLNTVRLFAHLVSRSMFLYFVCLVAVFVFLLFCISDMGWRVGGFGGFVACRGLGDLCGC